MKTNIRIVLLGLLLWGTLIGNSLAVSATGTRTVGYGIAFSASGRSAVVALACPFCNAVQQTIAEQMNTSDVVVLADLVRHLEPPNKQDALPKAIFKVTAVVKGKPEFVAVGQEFQGIVVGQFEPGQRVLVMGVNPPETSWTTPIKVTSRGEEYLKTIPTLPDTGVERLKFFQKYLQDEEPFLAFDAYEEFARAPYADVEALKPFMDHDQLVAWLKDPEVSSSRKRLYFTLLGVCGSAGDLPMLESMMKSESGEIRRSLDAMVACYLTIRGEQGLDLIDELFLNNPKCDYVDAFSAISAIRFHAMENKQLSRERILQSFHHVLNSPERADLIIPDLARWEDWSVIDRMVDLFKTANESSQWVRVPVISYLQICPKPEAKTAIEELRKVDPEAVRRAESLLSWETGGDEGAKDEFDQKEPADDDAPAAEGQPTPADKGDGKSGDGQGTIPTSLRGKAQVPANGESGDATETPAEAKAGQVAVTPAVRTPRQRDEFVSTLPPGPTPAANRNSAPAGVADTSAPEVVAQTLPLRWSLLVMVSPVVVGGLVFLLLWSVIHGWFERLIF